MDSFSFGDAWANCTAYIRENLVLLVTLVGGLNLFAGLCQYWLMGPEILGQQAHMMEALRSGDWQNLVDEQQSAAAMGGAAPLWLGLVALVPAAGELAVLRLTLAPDDRNIVAALAYGVVAIVLQVLLLIALVIAASVALAIPLVLLGMGAAFTGSGGAAMGAVGIITILICLIVVPLAIWAAIRLCLMQPAMAAVPTINPLAGLTASWQLTRGHAGGIFLYSVLIGVAMIVVFLLASAIILGLGAIVGDIASMILSAVFVGIPFAILSVGISVGIYRTLAPSVAGQVFS
jgi:hypothetical protein